MIQISREVPNLTCPQCQSQLMNPEVTAQCRRCQTKYTAEAGIPNLMPEDLRTDYGLAADHGTLNMLAKQIGWRQAVFDYTTQHDGGISMEYANEYICSEARADFRYLLPVKRESITLDVGSGWGNITCAFARVCRHVIALDISTENLHFVETRTQQEDLHNVTVAQGDVCTLPVQNESCDIALMVGVLGWAACGRNDGLPQELQKQALGHICRALKSGGTLYLATDNRFSIKYFWGTKESHTGLRFISLLPYPVARRYSNIVRNQDFREVTYSFVGLHKLLHSIGFDKVKFHFPVPGYENFRFIVNLEDNRTNRFWLKQLLAHPRFSYSHYLVSRLLFSLPFRIEKYFWPSFSVVATKQ